MIEISIKDKVPYNQLPITLVLNSINRKVYRDQYCIECGHPFVAISDKFVSILDSSIPIEKLRETERLIEARCRHHYCKQHYRVYV